jgi:hypothetical protein
MQEEDIDLSLIKKCGVGILMIVMIWVLIIMIKRSKYVKIHTHLHKTLGRGEVPWKVVS